jgi:hypothetical protein
VRGVQGEVGALAVPRRAEGVGPTRPDRQWHQTATG